MNDRTQLIGWAQAFLAVLVFLGLNNVAGRYGSHILEINPIITTCSAFASCSLILLIVGGKGGLARETVRSFDTWAYGTILMMSYILGFVLFSYVTSTEGALLQKISILLGVIGSWFFLGRKPDIFQIIGTIIITTGVIIVAFGIESENNGAVYVIAFLYGLMQVARIFVAELHRPHNQAAKQRDDPKAKIRVVSFVMFNISLVFFVLTLLLAFAQEQTGKPFIEGLPMYKDFVHYPSIFLGLIMGVILIAPNRLLEFSSSNIIKAENFTVVTAFSFVSVLFLEWITIPLTGLSIVTVSSLDIFAGFLIVSGALLMAITKMRYSSKNTETWRDYIKYEGQNLTEVEDSKDVISNTLEFCKNDVEKAARILDIPVKAIIALKEDTDNVLAFKTKTLKDVERLYINNVALKDALTGLLNRSGFMKSLRDKCAGAEEFHLLYIDLDKFKPVNDTYGHEAGDIILQVVAERLSAYFYQDEPLTRMGGDEFCVLQDECNQEELDMHVRLLVELLSEPYKVKGVKQEINISASIGVASFPSDGVEPETLLNIADGGMYADKDNKN